MKYTVQRLDGRHSYQKWFQYYAGFSNSMSFNKGPLHFTQAQQWCFRTWGWSAEVRQWNDIYRWSSNHTPMMRLPGGFVKQTPSNLPEECNPYWSWTNGSTSANELRIYFKSDAELAFFQLANAVDQ
jgi:hypothetical protein